MKKVETSHLCLQANNSNEKQKKQQNQTKTETRTHRNTGILLELISHVPDKNRHHKKPTI